MDMQMRCRSAAGQCLDVARAQALPLDEIGMKPPTVNAASAGLLWNPAAIRMRDSDSEQEMSTHRSQDSIRRPVCRNRDRIIRFFEIHELALHEACRHVVAPPLREPLRDQ